MKTIKLLATIICMFTMISVNAQTTDGNRQVHKKVLTAKKPTNVPKAKLSNEPVKIDDKDAKTGTKKAEVKKDKPSDKAKMKQIGRPVKVTPK